jgi:hypothetical protein
LSISGHLLYAGSGEPIEAATVNLLGPENATTQTDSAGFYEFQGLSPGSWAVRPSMSGGTNAAIAGDDALAALDVAVGLQTTSAAGDLACDVTANGAVSAYDASLILQHVGGTPAALPVVTQCASTWGFIPLPTPVAGANTVPLAPSPGPCQHGAIAFDPLTQSAAGQNFAGLVFGDCTLDWAPAP